MGEALLRNEPAMPKELAGTEIFVLIDNVSDGMSNRHVSCWLKAEVTGSRIYVRSTPSFGHSWQVLECLSLTQPGSRMHLR